MPFLVPERAPAAELLDSDVDPVEARASLADIEWVHRRLGGRRMVRKRLVPLFLSLGAARLTMVDLGSGSGHVGCDLSRALAERGRTLTVLDVDRKLSHCRLAPRTGALAADALRLPLRDRSVDVVLSTLFVHHFSPEEVRTLLFESVRVARRAVVFLDLARHRVALAAISAIGPLVFKSRLSVEDGRTSVRQAYTPAEARLIASVIPGASVAPVGLFVWQLTWFRT